MSMMRLSPRGRLAAAGPPRDGRAQRRRAWTLGISVLFHALVVAALLTLAGRRNTSDEAQEPAYQLMFETPDSNAPLAIAGQPDSAPPTPEAPPAPAAAPPPPPAPPTDALPGPETPNPTSPPVPDAPLQPPALPPPLAPPLVAAPAPPTLIPPAPTPPAETPPTPEPPSPAPSEASVSPEPESLPPPSNPPEVRLESPQEQPLPEYMPPAPPLPAPSPPMPALPTVPAPPRVAQSRPHTAPPQTQAGTFANPMDLNFGSAPARPLAPRATAPRGSVASRSLDLSPGAPKGPNRAEAFFDARAARLGVDWQAALMAYWLAHRYYPQQAAQENEDGTVDLELTVGANGQVQTAVLKSRSGSQFIDMAAVGTWRNAKLPPLPPELGAKYTFTITINYILLR